MSITGGCKSIHCKSSICGSKVICGGTKGIGGKISTYDSNFLLVRAVLVVVKVLVVKGVLVVVKLLFVSVVLLVLKELVVRVLLVVVKILVV